MGVDITGTLCYGIKFEEGFEFPWDKAERDIDDWWEAVSGYKPKFYPYDEKGNYKEDVDRSDPRINEYYKEKEDWWKKNPLPIELVDYCGDGCDYNNTIILAIPGCIKNAEWGEPTEIENIKSIEPTLEEISSLMLFCDKCEIDVDEESVKLWLTAKRW